MPGDAGPKTNALKPLLEPVWNTSTVLEKLETLPKTNCKTVFGPFGKGCEFHQRAPLQSPSFPCSRKRAICFCFFFVFCFCFFFCQVSLNLSTLYTNFKSTLVEGANCLSSLTGSWEIQEIQLWCGGGLKWSPCLAANSCQLLRFPKRLRLWKSTRRNRPSTLMLKENTGPAPFLPSKWPYNIHAN